jgi:hypothetical protein
MHRLYAHLLVFHTRQQLLPTYHRYHHHQEYGYHIYQVIVKYNTIMNRYNHTFEDGNGTIQSNEGRGVARLPPVMPTNRHENSRRVPRERSHQQPQTDVYRQYNYQPRYQIPNDYKPDENTNYKVPQANKSDSVDNESILHYTTVDDDRPPSTIRRNNVSSTRRHDDEKKASAYMYSKSMKVSSSQSTGTGNIVTQDKVENHIHPFIPSAIVSPTYDDDDDDNIPSSLSSRHSYEKWEDVVHPPPFIHDIYQPSNSNDDYYQESYNHYNVPEPTPYHTERVHPSYNRYDYMKRNQYNVPTPKSLSSYGDAGSNRKQYVEEYHHQQQQHQEAKMIEITPGNVVRLRDANETVNAIRNDHYVPCSCMLCCSDDVTMSNEPIFCIQDAEYFLCPHCKSINRLHDDLSMSNRNHSTYNHSNNHTIGGGGGVGLGFTMKTIFEVHNDLLNLNN